MSEKTALEQINSMRDVQRDSAEVSPYMTGFYNGLELASATLEGREPGYINPPTATISAALDAIKAEKPCDRSDLDRRYAIVITELEKVLAISEKFLAK